MFIALLLLSEGLWMLKMNLIQLSLLILHLSMTRKNLNYYAHPVEIPQNNTMDNKIIYYLPEYFYGLPHFNAIFFYTCCNKGYRAVSFILAGASI